MTAKNGNGWKMWVIGILTSVLLIFLAGFTNNVSQQVKENTKEISELKSETSNQNIEYRHIVEKLNKIEKDLDEIKKKIK